MAAKQAIIEYDKSDLGPAIVTVEQAVENNSYIKVPPDLYPKEVGDVAKGMAEADHVIPSAEVCSITFRTLSIFVSLAYVQNE
jgi:hypothetical protein